MMPFLQRMYTQILDIPFDSQILTSWQKDDICKVQAAYGKQKPEILQQLVAKAALPSLL